MSLNCLFPTCMVAQTCQLSRSEHDSHDFSGALKAKTSQLFLLNDPNLTNYNASPA